MSLIEELKFSLASSDSRARKHWAQQIINDRLPLESLLPLLHYGDETSQRFMWLIGDVCEAEPDVVAKCLPILFSLRDAMPFPGMPRSVAKWLLLTNIPESVEAQAKTQLMNWLGNSDSSIACKSYSAKALVALAGQKRIAIGPLKRILKAQSNHENRSYGFRIGKLLERLS